MENEKKEVDNKQFRAAYALNMCTVSVSQIVDYNDIHILEQEYDAILNNINLERMPKDEALLNILVELLNTVSFFKIYDIKEKQIEEKYQNQMKNAIWSAIPNLGVIVASGNPIVMACSLATQIGSSYMNYRRTKANALEKKEDSAIELQITAIEQLNAIKRELFTTAWRLSDRYNFSDEYRLTEKQIHKYNEILMDNDELRKFERLEVIQNQFKAYPPFWYFLGHTAHRLANGYDISIKMNESVKMYFNDKAKECFEYYEKFLDYNILREDKITSAYALEYADFLLEEHSKDINKINRLIDLAYEMSKNANDILQMCSISYLKIGEVKKAQNILKILVNENFNTKTNARLLSKLYVSEYIDNADENVLFNYNLLESRINDIKLFPMPVGDTTNPQLLDKYITSQKEELLNCYENAIKLYKQKYNILFNQIIPLGDDIDDTLFLDDDYALEKRMNIFKQILESSQKIYYKGVLKNLGFRNKYLLLFDEMINNLQVLSIFNDFEYKDALINTIRTRIKVNKGFLYSIQRSMEDNEFNLDDYEFMENELSFDTFTFKFYELLLVLIKNYVMDISDYNELELADDQLQQFCQNEKIDINKENISSNIGNRDSMQFFNVELLGKNIEVEFKRKEKDEQILELIANSKDEILKNKDSDNIKILLKGEEEFNEYLKDIKVSGNILDSILAVIDDRTTENKDLLLTDKEAILLIKNKYKDTKSYKYAECLGDYGEEYFNFSWFTNYENKYVNIRKLKELFDKILNI